MSFFGRPKCSECGSTNLEWLGRLRICKNCNKIKDFSPSEKQRKEIASKTNAITDKIFGGARKNPYHL